MEGGTGLADWLILMTVLSVAAGPLVLALRKPLEVGLPAYAVSLPFGGFLSLPGGEGGFGTVSSVLGLVVVVGLLLRLVNGSSLDGPLSATVPLWLLLLGLAGATVFWSIQPEETVEGFVALASLVVLYVLVAASRVTASALRRFENGLLLGGFLVVCYGLAQLLLLGGFPHGPQGAPSGRFGEDLLGPNNEAVALLVPLILALRRSSSTMVAARRFRYGALAAFLTMGIVFTGSRGGMIAAALAILVLAASERRGRRVVLAYLAAGIAAVTVVLTFHPAGIAEREVEASSTSGRLDVWRVGLAACPEHCPLGSGWGTFPEVYGATQPSVPEAAVLSAGGAYEAHNIWLLVAIELGIPGFALFVAVFWMTLLEGRRLPRGLRGPALAAFAGTWFAGLFLSNIEFKSFWVASLLVALSRNLTLGHSDASPGARAGAGAAAASGVSEPR